MPDPRLVLLPEGERPLLWHVTLVVGGARTGVEEVRAALGRLAEERAFLISARYTDERAELRYWEEASCLDDAAALALRLWGEHRRTAGLPAWAVTGLEVLDRGTFHWRAEQGSGAAALVGSGGIRPF
ncbi:hypothetical protein [Vallicoccus soli]|uniref:Uncharacterized protein n=1 Tax=Vallicoccus soli TaxID=2339232 RepID=A0A3A3Z1M0_9ACTN|nr:hypothetical protein [Vallicoccus soli]RJK97073.1 hypothetical protein D5H78_07605 [Vallicoccus soli]